ncbi:MAG: CHC2 zinc finger domain-containing protein, partial [Nitrospira sp.]|nr:CHC2 zinc finger domain-containing protein [Nitrospira sp.]
VGPVAPGDPAGAIARALKGRKTGENEYFARCPSHDEKTASLAIAFRDGKVLVHCFGGCDWREVLFALADMGLWERSRMKTPLPFDPDHERMILFVVGGERIDSENSGLPLHRSKKDTDRIELARRRTLYALKSQTHKSKPR